MGSCRWTFGSAIDDTTRELGGTLGVDVIGSVSASLYTNALAGREGSIARSRLAFAVLQLLASTDRYRRRAIFRRATAPPRGR